MIERPDIPEKAFPVLVTVRAGERWLDASAHGTRIGRRGRQVLISDGARLVWVAAERVRTRTDRSADTARISGLRNLSSRTAREARAFVPAEPRHWEDHSMTAVPNEPYRTGQPPADPTTGIEQHPSTADQSTGISGPRQAAQYEAVRVKDTAVDAARDVTGTAKGQGAQVVSDVRDQAHRLTRETRTQLAGQAASQRDRAVGSLRSMSEELRTMADKADQPGSGSQLAHKGADYAQQLADYLSDREPGQLVDGVRGFARRRPGMFLLGAAAAGVVVGRLSRGAVDARTGEDRPTPSTGDARPTPSIDDDVER